MKQSAIIMALALVVFGCGYLAGLKHRPETVPAPVSEPARPLPTNGPFFVEIKDQRGYKAQVSIVEIEGEKFVVAVGGSGVAIAQIQKK